MVRRSVSVGLAVGLVLAALFDGSFVARAAAQPPTSEPDAETAEAQALFRRGIELSAEDRWADALEHFRRSHARVPRPSTLFNIGVTLGRLGRFVEAIAVFDAVLAEASLAEGPRAEALRLRAEAVASVAELTLALTPPTATLSVDGVLRPGADSPRIVPLDPGRHVLRAAAPAHDEGVLEVSVRSGEHAARSLELGLSAPPAEGAPTRTVFDEPAFWIVGGALVVAIGVGTGVGVALSTPAPQYGGSTGVVLLPPGS
jgi:tetratricopeptide (TPR) repeat protein